MMMTKTCNY